jgi:hypothetical protein
MENVQNQLMRIYNLCLGDTKIHIDNCLKKEELLLDPVRKLIIYEEANQAIPAELVSAREDLERVREQKVYYLGVLQHFMNLGSRIEDNKGFFQEILKKFENI